MNPLKNYSVTVWSSEEDECYLAKAPAFEFVMSAVSIRLLNAATW